MANSLQAERREVERRDKREKEWASEREGASEIQGLPIRERQGAQEAKIVINVCAEFAQKLETIDDNLMFARIISRYKQ